VNLLLERGARVDTVDDKGRSVLHKVMDLKPNLDWLSDLGQAMLQSVTVSAARHVASVLGSVYSQLQRVATSDLNRLKEIQQVQTRYAELERYAELRELTKSSEVHATAEVVLIGKLKEENQQLKNQIKQMHQQLEQQAKSGLREMSFSSPLPTKIRDRSLMRTAPPSSNGEGLWSQYKNAALLDEHGNLFLGRKTFKPKQLNGTLGFS